MNKHDLFDRIEQLTKDLAVAKADVALLNRLKEAEANLPRIADELEQAQKNLVTLLNDEQRDKRLASYAGIKTVTITDKTPGENVLGSTFAVTVIRNRFDHDIGANAEQQEDYVGFGIVPAEVLAYIVDKQPPILPAKILDLAPGNPAEAFDRFMVSKRRGYVVGAAA